MHTASAAAHIQWVHTHLTGALTGLLVAEFPQALLINEATLDSTPQIFFYNLLS